MVTKKYLLNRIAELHQDINYLYTHYGQSLGDIDMIKDRLFPMWREKEKLKMAYQEYTYTYAVDSIQVHKIEKTIDSIASADDIKKLFKLLTNSEKKNIIDNLDDDIKNTILDILI